MRPTSSKSFTNALIAAGTITVLLISQSLARAQAGSGFNHPLTLAPADAASSGGGGEVDDAKAKAAELAKELQNPIAKLISVPFQNNFDFGAGPAGDGFQYKVNVQPVVPFTLSEDWNLITRTILPIVYQEKIVGTSSQAGLADTMESLFFSPSKPAMGGWIWGAGPAFLLPTATDDLLGAEKWGAGPTAVVLKQQKGWTYGALANHIWSFAGESERRGRQRHLPAAVRLLHHEDVHQLHTQHRVHLRLARPPMDGARELYGPAVG